MYRIDLPIVCLVSAQIPALDPDLETSPRRTNIRVDASSIVWIIGESYLKGKHAGVSRQFLPSNSHVTDSIPMILDVETTQTAFSPPISAQSLGNCAPADRIPVPCVSSMLLCTVRSTLVYSIAFIAYQFTRLK